MEQALERIAKAYDTYKQAVNDKKAARQKFVQTLKQSIESGVPRTVAAQTLGVTRAAITRILKEQ